MPVTKRGAEVVAEAKAVVAADVEPSEASVRSALTKMATSVRSSKRLWTEQTKMMRMRTLQMRTSSARGVVGATANALGVVVAVASTEAPARTVVVVMVSSAAVVAVGEAVSIAGSRPGRTTMLTLMKKSLSSNSMKSKCASISPNLIMSRRQESNALARMLLRESAISLISTRLRSTKSSKPM